ncbi:JmjC domain-containing protein [Candidatus Microthrix parvicella]|uniref:JmjC domain-containing protein n=1 Tax=Candidatus Neomicrothrix parvicella RN1 TaxID=1229780 RepID=R4Z3L9_9ACTN|nr:cupin domain-containing protein [Candidatus Microthrix parvicella]CCM65539.1 hypothetical protein BN381_80069 [Candidatus Microthrix parvicella RN1]
MPGEPLGTTPRHLHGIVEPTHRADPDVWWEDLLHRSQRAPSFRMVRDGAVLPRNLLCRRAGVGHQQLDDLVEPNRVLQAYENGASLVLQGLQHSDPAMAKLSTNLALELNQPIQLNAYLSPSSARGLDLHFDYHDVIVVQLTGSKAWRTWHPLERSRLPQKRGAGIPRPQWDELSDPLIEAMLKPGDALVIPRGHPHAASTNDDESAHLTVGVMSLTWQALFAQLLRSSTGGSALAATASFDADGRLDALKSLDSQFNNDVLQRAHRLEVWKRQPRTRLRPRRAVFAPEAPLRFTPGPLLWLDHDRRALKASAAVNAGPGGDEASVSLQLGDMALTFPSEAAPFLALLLNEDAPFTVRSLADAPGHDLDDASVQTVLTALHREGVVAHGPL